MSSSKKPSRGNGRVIKAIGAVAALATAVWGALTGNAGAAGVVAVQIGAATVVIAELIESRAEKEKGPDKNTRT